MLKNPPSTAKLPSRRALLRASATLRETFSLVPLHHAALFQNENALRDIDPTREFPSNTLRATARKKSRLEKCAKKMPFSRVFLVTTPEKKLFWKNEMKLPRGFPAVPRHFSRGVWKSWKQACVKHSAVGSRVSYNRRMFFIHEAQASMNMNSILRSIFAVALALLVLTQASGTSASAQEHFPGKEWEVVASPAEAGWSAEKLKAAREFAGTLDTAAVMVISDGRIVDQWGATTERFNVHSIRKSFLSALYGIAAEAKQIDLTKALVDLEIDDCEPSLTTQEKQACVCDLLKARSGIYHPAAYETASMRAKRPERGSHLPGTFWYYNNWDFNALGTIYQKCTSEPVFEAFASQIAEPLAMEDFRLEDTKYVRDEVSEHPAYTFRMTARDMARFGLLFLRKGKWNGRQIVPESWVAESTKSYSDAGDSGGYGYMWWVAAGGKHFPNVQLPDGSFSARGHGGHYIVVAPEYDLVVVHRVNTDVDDNKVTSAEFGKLLGLILEACPKAAGTSSAEGREQSMLHPRHNRHFAHPASKFLAREKVGIALVGDYNEGYEVSRPNPGAIKNPVKFWPRIEKEKIGTRDAS